MEYVNSTQAQNAFASMGRDTDPGAQAPLTVLVMDRLRSAVTTTDRLNDLVNEKHHNLYGMGAPTAPTALPVGKDPNPAADNFESQVRSILARLIDRLGDLENATASLVNRL